MIRLFSQQFSLPHRFSLSTSTSILWWVICGMFLVTPMLGVAQGQANYWHFGNEAGLKFNVPGSQVVEADTNGVLNTFEGCATISDNNGNLLFYTDGDTIWDSNHSPMPNAFNLGGHPSSTQSAIIVPKPQDSDNYYVFTVGNLGDSLFFSEVDLALNGGQGDVVLANKRTFIEDTITEKIAAMPHSNGTNVWVLTHRFMSNEYLAYEVSPTGVNLTPVVSAVGPTVTFFANAGYMKGSLQGDRIAAVYNVLDSIILVDFSPTNGLCSNPLVLDLDPAHQNSSTYGIEFSPDGNLLYVSAITDSAVILQYNLQAGNTAAIQASETSIAPQTSGSFGALQLGVDDRIYFTQMGDSHLHRINSPNTIGIGCNYTYNAIFLEGRTSSIGLPTFYTSSLTRSRMISSQRFCLNDTTFFALDDTTNIGSVLWNFGDPASGVDSISTDLFPGHIFSDTGLFSVTISIFANNDTTFDTTNVFIFPVPVQMLGPDVRFCEGDSVTLNAGSQPLVNYLWLDNSIDSTLVADTAGQYTVSLFNACDTVMDTILVGLDEFFAFDLGNDTAICSNQPLVLNPDVANANYSWQDNSNNTTFNVTADGTYRVTVSNTCDNLSDSIVVTTLSLPVANLPNDTLICNGQEITLFNAQAPGVSYQWSDLSTGPSLTVDQSGTYWLFATGQCGSSIDTVVYTFERPIDLELGEDLTVCTGDTILLNANSFGATYLWNNGSTTHEILVIADGIYSVTVSQGNCTDSDTIAINFSPLACFVPIDCSIELPNVFTPNFDGLNDYFGPVNDCNLTSYKLRIFNRWGHTVFESEAENIQWDGFVTGSPAPAGVYYWILEFEDQVVVEEDRQNQTGSFSLLR